MNTEEIIFKDINKNIVRYPLSSEYLFFVASITMRYAYLDFCPNIVTISPIQFCTLEYIGKSGIEGSDSSIICINLKLSPKNLFTAIHRLEQFGLMYSLYILLVLIW